MPTDLSRPDTFLLKVAGAELADAIIQNIISVRVEARIGVPAIAEIRMADPNFTIIDGTTFEIGKEVTVTAGGSTVVFTGEILGVTVDYNPETVTELEASAAALDLKLDAEQLTAVDAINRPPPAGFFA